MFEPKRLEPGGLRKKKRSQKRDYNFRKKRPMCLEFEAHFWSVKWERFYNRKTGSELYAPNWRLLNMARLSAPSLASISIVKNNILHRKKTKINHSRIDQTSFTPHGFAPST